MWALLGVTWAFLLLLIGLGFDNKHSGWLFLGHLVSLFAFAPALLAHAVRQFPWHSMAPRIRIQSAASMLYLPAVLASGWLFVWLKRAA